MLENELGDARFRCPDCHKVRAWLLHRAQSVVRQRHGIMNHEESRRSLGFTMAGAVRAKICGNTESAILWNFYCGDPISKNRDPPK